MDNPIKHQVDLRAKNIPKLVMHTIHNHRGKIERTHGKTLRELTDSLANDILRELVQDIRQEPNVRSAIMNSLKAEVMKQLHAEIKAEKEMDEAILMKGAELHEAEMAERGISREGDSDTSTLPFKRL